MMIQNEPLITSLYDWLVKKRWNSTRRRPHQPQAVRWLQLIRPENAYGDGQQHTKGSEYKGDAANMEQADSSQNASEE